MRPPRLRDSCVLFALSLWVTYCAAILPSHDQRHCITVVADITSTAPGGWASDGTTSTVVLYPVDVRQTRAQSRKMPSGHRTSRRPRAGRAIGKESRKLTLTGRHRSVGRLLSGQGRLPGGRE